jgi:hypothetical protein
MIIQFNPLPPIIAPKDKSKAGEIELYFLSLIECCG